MAGRLVSTALTEMRAILRDSSASPAFTDAQGIHFLNIGYLWMHENMERRAVPYVSGGEFSFVAAASQDWAPGTYFDDIEFTSDAAEILEVALSAEVEPGGVANQAIVLHRLPWSELRFRQSSDATLAEPTHWAALKLNGSYRWRLALYPLAGYANPPTDTISWRIIGSVRHQPTPLSLTTHKIDLGDSETDAMITIAAALMAPRIGRPELGAHLWTVLPRVIQDKMETTRVHDEVNA